jgi:hypothetical protein
MFARNILILTLALTPTVIAASNFALAGGVFEVTSTRCATRYRNALDRMHLENSKRAEVAGVARKRVSFARGLSCAAAFGICASVEDYSELLARVQEEKSVLIANQVRWNEMSDAFTILDESWHIKGRDWTTGDMMRGKLRQDLSRKSEDFLYLSERVISDAVMKMDESGELCPANRDPLSLSEIETRLEKSLAHAASAAAQAQQKSPKVSVSKASKSFVDAFRLFIKVEKETARHPF